MDAGKLSRFGNFNSQTRSLLKQFEANYLLVTNYQKNYQICLNCRYFKQIWYTRSVGH